MRAKIVAGNWKMHTTIQEGIELAKAINKFVEQHNHNNVKVVLGTPFTHLDCIVKTVDYKLISIAAQDCSIHEKGAFTGEISVDMIRSTGTHYIIIGHSERRTYHNETEEILSKKVGLALKYSLRPIYCCGERLEERESAQHFNIVRTQIEKGLFHLTEEDMSHVVIAYEPVWAIGTGRTASPEQAQEMHEFIRKTVAEKYGTTTANNLSILYGGSCNTGNAESLFSQPDVDGGLIGGASLKPDDFTKIIEKMLALQA